MNLPAQLSDLLEYAEGTLLGYRHVVGVGFGWKETQGNVTCKPALRVYVRQKISRAILCDSDVIPPEVSEIATDVLPVQAAVPVSGTTATACSMLMAGASVSNLKGVTGNCIPENNHSGLGALGFLAAINGSVGWDNLVLVSNHHVLLAHGARKGDPIYQPEYARRNGKYYFDRAKLNPVAEILDEGLEGNYRYSHPGEGAKEYFIDCATARLNANRTIQTSPASGTAPGGGRALFKGIARVHEFDVFAGRELRVHKLGRTTSEVWGRVLDVRAPVIVKDGITRQNNLLIRADARREESESCFAEDGDSGALVVDELNRAVGLLWGKSLRSGAEAFACHIHPVLHRLSVTPLPYDLPLASLTASRMALQTS